MEQELQDGVLQLMNGGSLFAQALGPWAAAFRTPGKWKEGQLFLEPLIYPTAACCGPATRSKTLVEAAERRPELEVGLSASR